MINKTVFLPEQQPLTDEEYEFIYQPICKVGCKTIKTWMLSLLKKDVIDDINEATYGQFMEDKHMDTDFNIHDCAVKLFGYVYHPNNIISNLSPVSLENEGFISYNSEYIELLDKDNFKFTNKINNYFKFTFVRNPWTRIISAYIDKFRSPGGITYKRAVDMNNFYRSSIPKKQLNEYFDGDNILSFEGFVDILYQQSKMSYESFDIHWIPQHFINDMYIGDFDFTGKLENFNKDFDVILEKLNIDIKPNYKIGSLSHRFHKHREFYKSNSKLIDKVAEIYKEDIKRYNYDFSYLEK